MHEWLEDEVASALGGTGVVDLFRRLDLDGDGKVDWEEFWQVVGEWMDTGFDRMEELRQQRKRLDDERARAAADAAADDDAARRAAEEAAAAEAARAEAERRRLEELAAMSVSAAEA